MKSGTRHLLMVLCGVVILVCAAVIISDQVSSSQSQSYDDGIRQLYKPASTGFRFSLIPTASAEVDWEIGEDKDEPEETWTVQADFEQLLATNEDTVGWLTCGERIDGPVVYRDNEYYLDHNFYGE